jgi:hypothetical protein
MRCPFTLIVGDESRLVRHLSELDVAEAMSRTRLIAPAQFDDPFPRNWAWGDAVCAVFPRPYRWRQETLQENLESLCLDARKLDRQIIFHVEFESDLRRLRLPVDPAYIMAL